MKNIVIVENKSEFGAGTRGSSLGIDALKYAAYDAGYEKFFLLKKFKIEGQINSLRTDFKFKYAKYIDSIIRTYKKIDTSLTKNLNKSNFPIFLTGDHCYSPAYISAIKKVYNLNRIGLIWIDAHADLHSPYTTPSGNIHGMSVAISLGEDNKKCQKNLLDKPVIAKWNNLKKLVKKKLILPENLIFIATRDKELEEKKIIKRNKIKEYSVKDIRENFEKSMKQIEAKLVGLDAVFVSFDVDSMDPELVSWGTGTPVKGGLTLEEANKLVTRFAKLKNICGFEIVEINPILDKNQNSMAKSALSLLQNFISNYNN
jgi:arginase